MTDQNYYHGTLAHKQRKTQRASPGKNQTFRHTLRHYAFVAGSTLDGSVLSDNFADVAPGVGEDTEVRLKAIFPSFVPLRVAGIGVFCGKRKTRLSPKLR